MFGQEPCYAMGRSRGFNRDGTHPLTGTQLDPEGYNRVYPELPDYFWGWGMKREQVVPSPREPDFLLSRIAA
jgi:hypothetical protein